MILYYSKASVAYRLPVDDLHLIKSEIFCLKGIDNHG